MFNDVSVNDFWARVDARETFLDYANPILMSSFALLPSRRPAQQEEGDDEYESESEVEDKIDSDFYSEVRH